MLFCCGFIFVGWVGLGFKLIFQQLGLLLENFRMRFSLLRLG